MSERGDAIVQVQGLVKDFRPGFGLRRKRVLHGVEFTVRRGEIFGFVGPNGAGKTTTLKILMGLVRPTAGRATVLGHDVRESAFRRHIGFLPENPYFYDYLSGRELLRFYARVAGCPARERGARIDRLLDWVGLAAAADQRLRSYSKGMLQRIGIAQALVHDPEVIFLDEPMSGLDPIGRKEIRDLIRHLRDEGKTVFMNTHILSDVEVLCDRVAIVSQGRVRFEGRTEDVVADVDEQAEVVLAAASPELVGRLEEALEARVEGRGERVELRLARKHVDEALEAALREGARVVSVSPHRRSLESFFLSTVREGR